MEKIFELNPDLIIIPGTKNTINDLRVIKQNGIFDKINELKNKGKIILGICGGYQMLGDDIIDSEGIEGEITSEKGFGFLIPEEDGERDVFKDYKTNKGLY